MLRKILLFTILAVAPAFGHVRHEPRPFRALPHLGSVRIENEVATSLGFKRYETEREVSAGIEREELIAIPESAALKVSKLPAWRRYARPETVAFLQELADQHYSIFQRPIVVDSAVRPTDVQRRLTRRNRCAAPADGTVWSSRHHMRQARPRTSGE